MIWRLIFSGIPPRPVLVSDNYFRIEYLRKFKVVLSYRVDLPENVALRSGASTLILKPVNFSDRLHPVSIVVVLFAL